MILVHRGFFATLLRNKMPNSIQWYSLILLLCIVLCFGNTLLHFEIIHDFLLPCYVIVLLAHHSVGTVTYLVIIRLCFFFLVWYSWVLICVHVNCHFVVEFASDYWTVWCTSSPFMHLQNNTSCSVNCCRTNGIVLSSSKCLILLLHFCTFSASLASKMVPPW